VLAGRTEDRLEAFVAANGYTAWGITDKGLVRLARVGGDPTYRQPNVLLAPADWSVPLEMLDRRASSAAG
jgi:hypothetical protein